MDRIFTTVFVLLGLAGMAVVWPVEERIARVERPVFTLDARGGAGAETAFLLDKASLEQQGFLVRSTSPGVPREVEVLERGKAVEARRVAQIRRRAHTRQPVELACQIREEAS